MSGTESSPADDDDDVPQHSRTSRSAQDGIAYLDVSSALAEFNSVQCNQPWPVLFFHSLPSILLPQSFLVFTPPLAA